MPSRHFLFLIRTINLNKNRGKEKKRDIGPHNSDIYCATFTRRPPSRSPPRERLLWSSPRRPHHRFLATAPGAAVLTCHNDDSSPQPLRSRDYFRNRFLLFLVERCVWLGRSSFRTFFLSIALSGSYRNSLIFVYCTSQNFGLAQSCRGGYNRQVLMKQSFAIVLLNNSAPLNGKWHAVERQSLWGDTQRFCSDCNFRFG